jgi:hypothetical protein
MPDFKKTICHLIITAANHSASLRVLATQKRSDTTSIRGRVDLSVKIVDQTHLLFLKTIKQDSIVMYINPLHLLGL